jgi:2-polyprenyl-6-methoxyphenol hydroxylase-like FAD-dependent oxidoreductase
MKPPMHSNGRSATVVGGGLGGLTVGTALARRGWRVQVFEQADELRMYGAGIWLWANGLRALAGIGVKDAVLACNGLQASAWEIRDGKNRLIRRRRCTAEDPLYVPRRADLYEALIDAANSAGVSITCSARVVSANADGSVQLEDGTNVAADLVVASDGVRSRVRESLGLTKECRGTGIGATRMLVPGSRGDDVILENWSGERAFLYNPCTPDETYLAFGGAVSDALANQHPVDVGMWQETFPHLADVIEMARGVEGHWDELSIASCHRWSAGRVAIIGDAAHALPPSLGQAANLAFGNAVALATTVSNAPDREIPSALEEWERNMRPLTDHVQKWSQFYNKVALLFPGNAERLKMLSVKYALRLPRVEHNLNMAARTRIEF